jgi:hypothetical protein
MKKWGWIAIVILILAVIIAIPFIVAKIMGNDAAGIAALAVAAAFGIGGKKVKDAIAKKAKEEGENAKAKIDATDPGAVVDGLSPATQSAIDAAKQNGVDAGVAAGLAAAAQIRTVQRGGDDKDPQGDGTGRG